MKRKFLNKIKDRRAKRTREKIKALGSDKPRFSIFKSNHYLYVQLIDDSVGKTLVSAKSPVKKAESLGEEIAQKAKQKKIGAAIFDRGKYKYHGLIKTVAESAKKGGLQL